MAQRSQGGHHPAREPGHRPHCTHPLPPDRELAPGGCVQSLILDLSQFHDVEGQPWDIWDPSLGDRGAQQRHAGLADTPHNPEYSLTQGPPYTSYVPRERIRGLVGYYPTQWQCQARWQRALGPRDLTGPPASRSRLHVAVIDLILCSQSL